MTADLPDAAATLSDAADRCRRLLDDVRRDAATLDRPSRLVSDDARVQGQAAFARTAAAAETLLRRLGGSPPALRPPADRPDQP